MSRNIWWPIRNAVPTKPGTTADRRSKRWRTISRAPLISFTTEYVTVIGCRFVKSRTPRIVVR